MFKRMDGEWWGAFGLIRDVEAGGPISALESYRCFSTDSRTGLFGLTSRTPK